MGQTFAAAATAILAEQGHRLPDLSAITVLVPHHHAKGGLLAALHAQAARPFLPPAVLTLPALAATQAEAGELGQDNLRLAKLFDLLGRIDWLDGPALWPQAQAMHDLLVEMDDALLVPPATYSGFSTRAELAIGRRLNAPLDREAQLIYEVWRSFGQSGFGDRSAYATHLSRWLAAGDGPVYSLGLANLSRLEQRFMAELRERRGLTELPVPAVFPERRDLLAEAWREDGEAVPLRDRARRFAGVQPQSPLAAHCSVLTAHDMETEACSVAARIQAWLAEGRRDIAVIALDRFAARRLRAVLERDAILMQDETGWTFSTASVSHVLDRWFALLQDDFYHRDVLDFLKSPFVFADLDADIRAEAVAALERAIARRNAVSGLDRLAGLVQDNPVAAAMLQRLARAATRFRIRRGLSISGWVEVLFEALADFGAGAAIEADNAGRQLLDLLRRLGRELAPESGRLNLSAWHGWLNLQLDRAAFQETAIESPIRLTHLAAARMRDFEAVVVLGADAAHLPPKPDSGLLGEGLRIELGLPGARERVAETRAALIDVLSRTERVLFSWQARRAAEPNSPSPWLQLLEAFHGQAYGHGLAAEPCVSVGYPPGQPPASVGPALPALPERLSASAWQKLVSCPYRYYAHYGLGLGEAEAVAETMEKADYGELLHELLNRFHAAHPVLSELPRETLLADLTALGEAAFAERERNYYLAVAWRLRWQRHVAAYLDWALAREAQGWRWRGAEQEFRRALELPDGQRIELFGRLDRLDESDAGQAVIDYKSQSLTRLKAKLATEGEDVQLPFYGLLTGAIQAGLVALDDDRVDMVSLDPLDEASAAEAERIRGVFSALAAGAQMPANGASETCAWCEMRGLCRKEHANEA